MSMFESEPWSTDRNTDQLNTNLFGSVAYGTSRKNNAKPGTLKPLLQPTSLQSDVRRDCKPEKVQPQLKAKEGRLHNTKRKIDTENGRESLKKLKTSSTQVSQQYGEHESRRDRAPAAPKTKTQKRKMRERKRLRKLLEESQQETMGAIPSQQRNVAAKQRAKSHNKNKKSESENDGLSEKCGQIESLGSNSKNKMKLRKKDKMSARTRDHGDSPGHGENGEFAGKEGQEKAENTSPSSKEVGNKSKILLKLKSSSENVSATEAKAIGNGASSRKEAGDGMQKKKKKKKKCNSKRNKFKPQTEPKPQEAVNSLILNSVSVKVEVVEMEDRTTTDTLPIKTTAVQATTTTDTLPSKSEVNTQRKTNKKKKQLTKSRIIGEKKEDDRGKNVDISMGSKGNKSLNIEKLKAMLGNTTRESDSSISAQNTLSNRSQQHKQAATSAKKKKVPTATLR